MGCILRVCGGIRIIMVRVRTMDERVLSTVTLTSGAIHLTGTLLPDEAM